MMCVYIHIKLSYVICTLIFEHFFGSARRTSIPVPTHVFAHGFSLLSRDILSLMKDEGFPKGLENFGET